MPASHYEDITGHADPIIFPSTISHLPFSFPCVSSANLKLFNFLVLFPQYAMFRAFSTRRSRGRYERLSDDQPADVPQEKLKRATSLPARIFSTSRKLASELSSPRNSHHEVKPAKNVTKSHPLFSLFDSRPKKKTTAKPEFSRYLEYVKEGGLWDMNLNKPVIHYK